MVFIFYVNVKKMFEEDFNSSSFVDLVIGALCNILTSIKHYGQSFKNKKEIQTWFHTVKIFHTQGSPVPCSSSLQFCHFQWNMMLLPKKAASDTYLRLVQKYNVCIWPLLCKMWLRVVCFPCLNTASVSHAMFGQSSQNITHAHTELGLSFYGNNRFTRLYCLCFDDNISIIPGIYIFLV